MTEQSNIHTTRRWFTEGWTDPSTEDIVGVDETVVVRVLWRGTHTGEYGGVPATVVKP